MHVLDWQDDLLAIPSLGRVKNGRVLDSGVPVKISQVAGGTVLHLPKRDAIDTVLVFDKVQ